MFPLLRALFNILESMSHSSKHCLIYMMNGDSVIARMVAVLLIHCKLVPV